MLHQIGIGTLGPVFRTYEPTRDRLVAVKVFRLDIVPEQAEALAAALSRAVHASLFHPSIVEPLDAGVEGTLAYRAEEYVAAESLDVAMRHYAPAPIEKVLPFMTQLAGAIDFARAAGIGHGGLHPRDIFVTPDEARATGFGVVEALEQVGIRAPIRRPYSAPERIDGSAWSTPADVFSLAAITFELLTSKRPAGTGRQIGALPDSAHAAAVHSVLARAMDDDPGSRYASALAFAGALEAASQGRPLTDAVSQVVAIAAVPQPPVVPAPEPPLPDTASRAGDAEPLDANPILAAPAADDRVDELPVTARTGEFEVEARLDPIHEALDEPAPVRSEPTLFADLRDDGVFEDVRDEDLTVGDVHQERFSDDFAADQRGEADLRSPLEEEPPMAPPAELPLETPMFQAADREIDAGEAGDRGRPAILPFAVVSVLMLLVGFAAGYFLGSRERLVPPQQSAQTDAPASATIPPAAAAGAATSEKAGNYSEQKVAAPAAASGAPAVVAAPPSAAAPSTAAASPRVTPPAPAPAPVRATSGELVVHSQPSHAGVTVNGTWRGRTPLTLGKLAFGTYAVRVVQPGYTPVREDVTLNARAPSRTITTRLERQTAAAPPAAAAPRGSAAPVSFVGSLYVDSRPRGATVMIDGRSVGQTPVSLPEVAAGSHVVRIEMVGKKPVMANPRVVAGKMERVTVSLEDK